MLKQAVNDHYATKQEDENALTKILKNIGVTEKSLKTEFGKLITTMAAVEGPISSQ